MKFYNVHVAERFLFDVKDSSHINQISLGPLMHGEWNIKIKGYIISLILDNGYINIFFWGGGGFTWKKMYCFTFQL